MLCCGYALDLRRIWQSSGKKRTLFQTQKLKKTLEKQQQRAKSESEISVALAKAEKRGEKEKEQKKLHIVVKHRIIVW